MSADDVNTKLPPRGLTVENVSRRLVVRELSNSRKDMETLDRAYVGPYLEGFTDPDEVESERYFQEALNNDATRGERNDRFHLLVAELDGQVVGMRVMNYQASSNTGMVQFWVVAEKMRNLGIGGALDRHGENLLAQDAKNNGHELHLFTGSEANHPHTYEGPDSKETNMDRMLQVYKKNWGALEVPYVQPALSEDQASVSTLKMLVRAPLGAPPPNAWPTAQVLAHIGAYYEVGMDHEDRHEVPEYNQLETHLEGQDFVRCRPVPEYIKRSNQEAVEVIAKIFQDEYGQHARRLMSTEDSEKLANDLLAQNPNALNKELPELASGYVRKQMDATVSALERAYSQRMGARLSPKFSEALAGELWAGHPSALKGELPGLANEHIRKQLDVTAGALRKKYNEESGGRHMPTDDSIRLARRLLVEKPNALKSESPKYIEECVRNNISSIRLKAMLPRKVKSAMTRAEQVAKFLAERAEPRLKFKR
jgi:hypothetical protein